jgi:hypothetical protein
MANLQRTLLNLYLDPSSPAGFRGPDALYQEAKRVLPRVTKKQVSNFILTQESYTKHRQFRPVKRYRRVMTKGIGYLWQIDLLDFSKVRYTRVNSGFKFILCVIDVFSKKLWTFPLRTKSATSVYNAMIRLLLPVQQRPQKIQADQGTEFFNQHFRTLLERFRPRIILYNTWTDKKASVVERVQRTLRNRLGKYWEHTGTKRWVDVLPRITQSYNNSFHRSIGMTPNEVTPANEGLVRRRLYPLPNPGEPRFREYMRQRAVNNEMANKARDKIRVGDLVRRLKPRPVFNKESDPNFTNTIYRVSAVRDARLLRFRSLDQEPITFKLETVTGRAINGSFYLSEIQKVL